MVKGAVEVGVEGDREAGTVRGVENWSREGIRATHRPAGGRTPSKAR